MNKIIALCIVTTVVTSVTGCGCCRRFRDFICRGSVCGATAVAAPAPIAYAAAPMPMAYDPGCAYAGADPGCGDMTAYPQMDSGWTGGQACESCSGGYSMPSSGGVLVDPNASSLPGPMPMN
jgi:hypothetical protein